MFRALLISLCGFVLFPIAASAATSFGVPEGYVNDRAEILSPTERSTLEMTLRTFHASTTKEVVVVTVPSLDGNDIASFANALFREWGIGDKERNDGVLLLVALKEREVRIEVGYGNEGELTDARSNRIIDEIIVPHFKAGAYGAGITDGIAAILAVLHGNPDVMQESSASTDPKIARFLDAYGGHLFLFIFFAFNWLVSMLGRSKSWWLGGVFGGIGAAVIMWVVSMNAGLIAMVFLVPLGLLFDFIVSRGYRKSLASGVTPPWWTGGGGLGGGSFGSGGFGGFGGGSSGGGGASSRW